MKKLLLPLLLSVAVSACISTQNENPLEAAAQKQALETNITPEQALDQAKAYLAQAQQLELDYYTPLGFAKIQQGLEAMTKLQQQPKVKEGQDPKIELLKEYFKLEDTLQQANKDKETIQTTLADSLKHKQILEELGSQNDLPNDYEDIQEDLIELFERIEKSEIQKAQNEQKDLLADMTELEVDTLLLRHLKPAQKQLAKAEDIDADDLAEQTYEKAEQKIEAVNKFIRINYRDRDDVKEQGNEALIAAQRAYNIAEQSKSMVKLSEEEAEQKALEIEALIADIRDAHGQREIRGLPLAEQVRLLAGLAKEQATPVEAADQ